MKPSKKTTVKPFLNNTQRTIQFGTTLTAAGLASTATFYTIAAIGVTGPIGVAATVAVATVYGLVFSEGANQLIQFTGSNLEDRRLKSLEGAS